MKKRLLSLALTLALCAGLCVSASAADNSIKQVEASYLFSMILTNGGDLYGCGMNDADSRPLGTDVEMMEDPVVGTNVVARPQKIAEDVAKIASSKFEASGGQSFSANSGHTLILKENGDLYALGSNDCGQLGQGDRNKHSGLQYVMDNVVDISCSSGGSFAITEDGDLYFWGFMMEGLTLSSDYILELSPVKILRDVKSVDGGAEHVAALKYDGTVWCMGNACYGALGNGENRGFSKEFVPAFSGAKAIRAGNDCTVAITEDNELYGWGNNSFGQLGADLTTNMEILSPTYIMSDVKSVDCGFGTTYVIKNNSDLWCMGWNYQGQMGLGYESHDGSPIYSLSNVKSVSGGNTHALVLKNDGSMYGCGQNYYAELGNGATQYRVYSWVPAGLTASPILDGSNPFTDVNSNDWFYDPVQWALEKHITTGTTATTFSPNDLCNRAQILTFLWRAADTPIPILPDWHDDVGVGDWFLDPVRWATETDMIPYNGNFYPYNPCTRATAVEFMWKYAGSPYYDTSSLPFTDVKSSASYAQAVAWALDNGVTTGTSATTFSPNATCTRAQIATFLYRAFA